MASRSTPAVRPARFPDAAPGAEAFFLLPLGPAAGDPRPLRLPLVLCRVRAGFPSPAEEYVEAGLDLNELLVKRPAATFFLRVEGDSMTGAGIHDGDLLVVDRAAEAGDGGVVVACVDGRMTVKRLRHGVAGELRLEAEHPDYPPLVFHPPQDECEDAGLMIWGVVVACIHRP